MDAVVVFADLLGFASLTEQDLVTENHFQAHDRPETDEFLTASLEKSPQLVQTYVRFQVALHDAISVAHKSGDHATSVAFSDSAFVAVQSFHTASALAIDLMYKLLPHGIMLRVGIATGSFVAIRFRADVSLGSGEHSAQFLGTGVVRAYATSEKSGLKGARILIHPSVQEHVERPQVPSRKPAFFGPLEIGPEEVGNALRITHEINYIGHKDRKLYRGVHRAQLKAPHAAQAQYVATYRAMNRMRAALQRPPLPSDLSVYEREEEG